MILDILGEMKVHRRCWLTLGLLCLSLVSVSGENWSRFRGPDGAGQSKQTAIPSVWTKDDYLWCETGETRWSVDRRSGTTAYSTPAIYRPNGGAAPLILASTAHGVSSFDPNTGRLNWELPDVFGTIRVTGSPVVAGGLIFAQCGAGGTGKRMV